MYKRKKWSGAIGYSLLIVVDVLTIFCDLGIDYCESAEKKH